MLLVLVAVIAAIPLMRASCREETVRSVEFRSSAVERSGRPARPEEAVIPGPEISLWERMLWPENLGRALRRVRANAGAPGADGMTTEELACFRLAEAGTTFRDLDRWLRRRLRQVRWKEWKTTAARRHNLRIRGISQSKARKWAGSSKGYWRVSGSQVLQVSLPNTYWDHLGLKTLSQTWQRLNRTA